MQIYDSGASRGKRIEEFGSHGVSMSTLMNARAWHVAMVELEPSGVLGAHKLITDQLLIVIQGSGRVSGGGGRLVDVAPGSAVFWNRGEVHETHAGAEGLVGIVIEGDRLERTLTMPIRKVTG